MAPTGEEGGGRAGGRDRAWDERKGGQSSCDGPRGRTGRGDVTHPPAARHCNNFFYRLGSILFPPSPSAVFSPSRTRWAVVPPEAGRLLGRGGVTTSGGPARSQPKRGNRWLLDRADGHGDFKVDFPCASGGDGPVLQSLSGLGLNASSSTKRVMHDFVTKLASLSRMLGSV